MEAFHCDVPTLMVQPKKTDLIDYILMAVIAIPLVIAIINNIPKTTDDEK